MMSPVEGFTKSRAQCPPGFFAVEAAGLAWLQVDGGARVVRPLAVSDTSITVERVHPTKPTVATAADLGRRLAVTHGAGASAFGVGPDTWSGDGFIGDAPLPLRPDNRWGRFFAEQRVLPYSHRALRQGDLDPEQARLFERLAQRLVDGRYDDEAPPARIHGDLWSGNVLYDADGAILIDPAAHGGHRITDLAMLALFGAPHLGTVLGAYAESAVLPAGWRGLLPLHQVHPLLVHTVLFGGGYGERAVEAARPFL